METLREAMSRNPTFDIQAFLNVEQEMVPVTLKDGKLLAAECYRGETISIPALMRKMNAGTFRDVPKCPMVRVGIEGQFVGPLMVNVEARMSLLDVNCSKRIINVKLDMVQ